MHEHEMKKLRSYASYLLTFSCRLSVELTLDSCSCVVCSSSVSIAAGLAAAGSSNNTGSGSMWAANGTLLQVSPDNSYATSSGLWLPSNMVLSGM
ncbi:hypothetical protein PISMIDRAFT_671637 [Pisolithus microcarpus 441]|uniref:Uncharacterized protein n=1 Tax=Pisolithus microcarpus 441 TaxID=765257 RepID=A0A0D0ACB6_9AGAM|nr:hypothetical protein BKA83DRAFT_671637 [Pisolithus microcarpus]KIK29703.1 hypothetical protein PISMIDRAFT_671637 [Pisolithus microcarpus 441]